MSFKIIFKQIYKGFLVNWKLFIMVILFCITTLSLIFGAVSFAIQFKNEIYFPATSKVAFSVGSLKNEFSYFNDDVSFKTNKKFENYFLEKINEIAETKNTNFKFTEEDMKKIYQEDGYVNWVTISGGQQSFYEKLVNYSADFLGNIRAKVLGQYLKEQLGWSFNIWNNQFGVGKLTGTSGGIPLFTTNIKNPLPTNLMKHHQIIADDPNFISVYISEHQLNKSNKIGDLINIKFDDIYHSKNLVGKIVGTFVDYINFADSSPNDVRFLIDNQDYFFFIKNQDIGYNLIDYRQYSDLNLPRISLFTNENYSNAAKYESQFAAANNLMNRLCFADFQGISLIDEFKVVYSSIHQKYIMIVMIMFGISFLLIILFYIVLYFLITQTIKSDLKISFFLNNLGMSYREISFIQILRLTIPIIFSIALSFIFSFGIKSLFWSAFSPFFNIHLNFLYFHWENLLVLLGSVVLIFGVLFWVNYFINWKLGKSKTSFAQVTAIDRFSSRTKSWFKIKNQHLIISLSYGAKNFFQVIFISLITLMIFLIGGFSLNFTKNIQNISQIATSHYAPIKSIANSKGKIIVEEGKNAAYSFAENVDLEAIGDDVDLKNNSLKEVILKLQKLLINKDLSHFYLSHLLTKQLTLSFANNFNQLQYQDLNSEIKGLISEEQFLMLQSIINECALLNSQLENNFSWTEGFNINFSQWTNNFSPIDQTFLSLENTVHDGISNLYLSSAAQAFAVNSAVSYYQTNFSHLDDDFSPIVLQKTPEQIARSGLDQDLDKNHDGKIVLNKIINAYFPFSYKNEKILKLKIYFNSQIFTEVYLRNVGVNQFDNWEQIFILNKKQLFEYLDLNFKNYQKDLNINLFNQIVTSQNFEQLDNGVYSTAQTPFFYQNILLRDDGKGKALGNYFSSLESLNIYGLNFGQIQKIIIQKMSQYNQLILNMQILLIILMVTISFIIIFLVAKENESYFQNFKALGYKTGGITNFLLPWYVVGIIFSAFASFCIIFFTNSFVGATLSKSLVMYLNYAINPVVYFTLIIIPLIFLLILGVFIYLCIHKVKVSHITS